MKAEIDAKTRFITTLPNWNSVSMEQARDEATHVKHLSEKEEQYELLVEAKRIESVVCDHEEMHHPITDRCPICLEDIKIKPSGSVVKTMVFFACPCANALCAECMELLCERSVKCPICQAGFTESEEERNNVLIKAAENGRPLAQLMMASSYKNGTNGFHTDKREALRWYKLAAEQNNPLAINELAFLHKEGDVVQQSDSKAVELMTKAANMGWTFAQQTLASWYSFGSVELPEDSSKALHYFTLACNQSEDSVVAYSLDMSDYNDNGGLAKSLILAKHYLGRAAKKGYKKAHYPYARALLCLWESKYSNKMLLDLPGHSVVPKCLYWLRKAALHGDSDGTRLVEQLEQLGKSKCSYCHKSTNELSERLKRCATCKGAWYCSRECQKGAWKVGHKTDCIQRA